MENGGQQPGFNPFGNLPPDVALVIDSIIARMVKKVEPEIQEIGRILRQNGSEGLTVQMGVKPASDSPAITPEIGIVSPYTGHFP